MTLTQEERIERIKQAVNASKLFGNSKIVEDFVADVRSEEVFGEYGLLDVQREDIEDEVSLIDYKPTAESIDEEDLDLGISDEMKGLYS